MNANTGDGNRLQGKRVAVLMTDGVEQVEYTEPRGYLEEADVCPPRLGKT